MFYRVQSTIVSPVFDKLMTAEEVSQFFNPVMRQNESETWLIDGVVATVDLIESIESTFKAPAEATLHSIYRKYPSVGDQLDALYRDIMNGTLTSEGEFASLISAVKAQVAKTEDLYTAPDTIAIAEAREFPPENTDSEFDIESVAGDPE